MTSVKDIIEHPISENEDEDNEFDNWMKWMKCHLK